MKESLRIFVAGVVLTLVAFIFTISLIIGLGLFI